MNGEPETARIFMTVRSGPLISGFSAPATMAGAKPAHMPGGRCGAVPRCPAVCRGALGRLHHRPGRGILSNPGMAGRAYAVREVGVMFVGGG
jgi:hypothetical protein